MGRTVSGDGRPTQVPHRAAGDAGAPRLDALGQTAPGQDLLPRTPAAAEARLPCLLAVQQLERVRRQSVAARQAAAIPQ